MVQIFPLNIFFLLLVVPCFICHPSFCVVAHFFFSLSLIFLLCVVISFKLSFWPKKKKRRERAVVDKIGNDNEMRGNWGNDLIDLMRSSHTPTTTTRRKKNTAHNKELRLMRFFFCCSSSALFFCVCLCRLHLICATFDFFISMRM